MDWANEQYILVYIRDTGDWLMWGWETRALLLFLFRKVDRAGILHLGKGKLRALAKVVEMPEDVVVDAIAPLLEDGCVQIHGDKLVIPNFLLAQEAKHSDKVRKQMSRERERARLLSQPVTRGHTESHEVTLPYPTQSNPSESDSDARAETRPSERRVRLTPVPPPPNPEPSEAAAPVLKTPPTHLPAGSEDAAPGNLRGAGAAASGGSERPIELVDRVWRELWEAKYRRPYEGSGRLQGPGSEDMIQVRVAEMASIRGAGAEAYLRHKFAAYLRDKGRNGWLLEKCHPFRSVLHDWAAYGEPKEPRRMVPRMTEDAPVALMSVDEMAARGSAFLGQRGATEAEKKASGER